MAVVTTFTFSSDTENVTRTKLNNLVANIKTEFNGNIDNDNIAADANIAYSKLNLTGAVLAADLAFTASQSSKTTFDNADLSSGVLTFNHALGQKVVLIKVFDNNDKEVTPDEITLTDTNNAAIDLSSFGTISGTWNIIANT